MSVSNSMDILKLEQQSKKIRRHIFEMILSAGKGHMGGSFSCTDILVALYQGGILRINPKDPHGLDRDRLILSKGHACEALYAVLAEAGFFSIDHLMTYGKPGTMLGCHVDKSIPGIEASTGSLGHGLSLGTGIALAAKLDQKSFRVFSILGDGECYEGSVWEAAAFASHRELNNLVAIVDRNGQITLDKTENCNKLEPFEDKWKSFGWDTEVIDGHSFTALMKVFGSLSNRSSKKPLVIIANTIKGRGVSFMEGNLHWHHNVPKGDQAAIARKDLGIDP